MISGLFFVISIVGAAKFESSETKRFPTPKSANLATNDESDIIGTMAASTPNGNQNDEPDSVGTMAASTHNGNQNRNAAHPTMGYRDKYYLMNNCSSMTRTESESLNNIKKMINKFGAKEVVNAISVEGLGYTCLHKASSHGRLEIITFLKDNGADLDAKDPWFETPLRVAIRKGLYESIKHLLKLGASLEKTKESDWEKWTVNKMMRKSETRDAIAEGLRDAIAKGQVECYNGPKGEEYRGARSSTLTGRACQKWTEQNPHRHSYTPERYPNAGLESNYCRNPSKSDVGPWCYTMDSGTRWEYCLIKC